MNNGVYLAIDWGTTNRRVYLLDADGAVLTSQADQLGVLSMSPEDYPAEIARLRSRFGDVPILSAGMIGSTRGWQTAPYVPAPAGLEDVARHCIAIDNLNVQIVPGVAFRDDAQCDVMRGEEVQVLGAITSAASPPDALFCQPGTHNKWIFTEGQRIIRFETAMTGELYALLRDHSILAEMMTGGVEDGPAFRKGVEAAQSGNLLSRIFGIRASVLLGSLPQQEAASFASGLLIGADLSGRAIKGRNVHLLADSTLGTLYASAIAMQDGSAIMLDSQQAFIAGIHAIWETLNA